MTDRKPNAPIRIGIGFDPNSADDLLIANRVISCHTSLTYESSHFWASDRDNRVTKQKKTKQANKQTNGRINKQQQERAPQKKQETIPVYLH